jgi:hypothetical protein
MKTKLSIACAVLAVILAGCDDGSGLTPGMLGTCHGAAGCGGDVVGTWSIASTCLAVDTSTFTADCPSATAHPDGYQITGMVTYDADLTFTMMTTLTGNVVAKYPAACLTPPNGAPVTCEQLRAGLLAPGRYASVDCAADGTGCDCTFGMGTQSFTGTGTYKVIGSVLLAGTADESDYCVKSDGTAAFASHPGAPVMGHQGLTAGSLTLTKQ